MIPNRNVVIIPAMKRSGNNGNKDEIPKLRVAAYCRVSTDSEEQSSSYDVQIEHYTEFIKKKNEGHLPQYYVENSHESIIPKELYLQVQEEIHRRSNIYTGEGKNKRIYSSKYALSAITFCGDCGDIYRRTYWNIHGRKEFVWRCVTRIEQGPEVCKNRTVKEDELYDAVMTAINRLLAGGNNMIKT